MKFWESLPKWQDHLRVARHARLGRWIYWSAPVWTVVAFYKLSSWLSSHFLHENIHVAWWIDLPVEIYLGYALLLISRRLWSYVILQGLLVGTFYLSNSAKIFYFDIPILPSDVVLLKEVLLVLEGWSLAFAVLPLALIIILFVYNFRPRLRHAAVTMLMIALPVGICVFLPQEFLDYSAHVLDYHPFRELENYEHRGPILYMVEETVRDVVTAPPEPTSQEVAAAVQAELGKSSLQPLAAPTKQRNLYLIVMETFWDPSELTAAGYNRDPWDPGLRKLWDATGRSMAMSPVFGGMTANAEFEILCGMPVYTHVVAFIHGLDNELPCLPRVLASTGYIAMAFHPNAPYYWNRIQAYHKVGFDQFYSEVNFDIDDTNGRYLADEATFRQAHDLGLKRAAGAPFFNYVMSISGHAPFNVDWGSRPSVVKPSYPDPSGMLRNEANSVYYSSKELYAYLTRLRAEDPDALIVVTGDHLPLLGLASAVYRKSHLFYGNLAKMNAEMMKNRRSTPLIVIDGRKGPVNVGVLPMYEIMGMILDRLGYRGHSMGDLFKSPPGMHIRPFDEGRLLVIDDKTARMEACNPDDIAGRCGEANAWMARAKTLESDSISGHRDALRLVFGDGVLEFKTKPGLAFTPPPPKDVCQLKVVNWGPHTVHAGAKVDYQPRSGQQVLWIQFTQAPRKVAMVLGSQLLDTSRGKDRIIGGAPTLDVTDSPGTYPLLVKCIDSGQDIKVGDFIVR